MGIRYTQPQTPVGIDWSNPLTRGLCLGNTASLFNNAVNGAPPTRKTISVSNKAETVYSHANGEIVFSAPGIRAFVGRYLFDPTNARFGGMFSSTNRSGIYFEYSSSQLKAVVFNNGAWSTTNIGSTPATGALITLAVVSDSGTSHRVYRDGVLVATLTNTAQVSTFNVAGAMYCDASTFYTAAVNGVVGFAGFTSTPSNTEIKSLSDNPWQIFKPQARRIWVAAAGGGDATATITGVSGSAQVGTVSTSGNASVSLPGASGAGSVGNVVASVSAATAITGVNGAGQVGNTTQTGAANVAVSTVAGTGQVGTVSASGIGAPDGNVAITGIAGTGQVGTLAASGNGAVSITGIAATGSVGSVTPSVTVTTTITGAIGTGSVGTTTQTGAANATVSSAVGIGLVGTVSATGTSQDGNAVISGISGIGSVGIVSANDGTVVNNHGFIIIDTEPRLWWKRKPSKLDDKKAEEKIFKVARVIERVVKHVANSNEPSVSKEVYRKAAYAEVAPLLREMPGFDWSPMFRAILTQSKLQEQNRIAAEQAGILAKQEIERIKRIRDDEEALIVLLMGA